MGENSIYGLRVSNLQYFLNLHGFRRSNSYKGAYKVLAELEDLVSLTAEVEKVITIGYKEDGVTIWKYTGTERHLGRFNHVYEYAGSGS